MTTPVVPRLVAVELRKIATTRGSRVFLVIVALLGGISSALIAATAGSPTVEVASVLVPLGLLFALALPILGILIMTTDWQTRDVMGMFLVQPRRGRTFVAKVVAALVAAVVLLAAAMGVALGIAAAAGLATGRVLSWGGVAEGLSILSTGSLVGTALGVALGAAIQNATGAIVLSFLQVLVLDPVAGFLPQGTGAYLQSSSISAYLLEGGALAPALTGLVLWLLAPGAIGVWRHLRREVC